MAGNLKKIQTSDLRTKTRKVSALHLLYVFIVAIQIIAFDAGQLITPTMTMRRWIACALLLSISAFVWYVAKNRSGQPSTLKRLIFALILSDIAFASYNVYIQRGMASRAVFLYIIPILVSAVLARRSALLMTSALCIAAYVTTTISYFVLNFNEGYKLELYGEIGFYCALLVLVSMLTWVFIRPTPK